MDRSMMRRSAGVILSILFTAALLLSSCRAKTSGDSGKDDIASYLSPMQISTESGQGALYEISGPAGAYRGSDLCCAGLYDETHLLLLRADTGCGSESGDAGDSAGESADKQISGSESGAPEGGYTAQLLDLCTGETSDLISFGRAASPLDPDDGLEKISILSCDPLIVHDAGNGILYFPGSPSQIVTLPSYLRDATPCCLDGRLWLSCDRGILFEVTSEGALRSAWTLPCEYGAFTPVVCGHSGRLSFATYSRRDPSLQVYVDVAPESGESEYYLSDINPSRFTVTQEGVLLGTSFRTGPVISLCDPSKEVKKELALPQEVLNLLNESTAASSFDEADSFLSFSTFPRSLCSDLCCFALCDDAGRPVHIYLWDTASCRSVSWKRPSVSGYTPAQTFDYGRLSERAGALQEQYGVRILLGENIPPEFSDYSAQSVTDASLIDGSLSVLENVLSLYPQNYFTQLKGDYYRDIVFYLTGSLQPLNAGSSISNASAFATESNGTMQLAFDLCDDLSPDTVIHELTHAADYRFAGEGLLDEDAWNNMNPEGFSYYFSYIDKNGESYETAGSAEGTAVSGCRADDVWFIDPYSKTYPMEDRARLMECLLSGNTPYKSCFGGKHVQEKLTFYFRFLRETLGDDSWPAQTSWEEALSNAATWQ